MTRFWHEVEQYRRVPLREAGFAEVGTLWQPGDNRLLCAVLPADQDG